MAPVKLGRYEFNTRSIADIRSRLKLSQAKFAELLGVPKNTVSRWETGTTTPDANSLAAIYSVAVAEGITPGFFKKAQPVQRAAPPSRLLVMLDFQSISNFFSPVFQPWSSVLNLDKFDKIVCDDLSSRFPRLKERHFKAFTYPQHSDALERLEWDVWEDYDSLAGEVKHHVKSDCGQNPEGTCLVLITQNEEFSELIQEMKRIGVSVYLLAPPSVSQKLHSAVAKKFRLPWPDAR